MRSAPVLGLLAAVVVSHACAPERRDEEDDVTSASTVDTRDAGTTVADSGTPEGTFDAGPAPATDAGTPGAHPLDGCWITHTNSGETELRLRVSGTRVTGTEAYGNSMFPLENGTLVGGRLHLTVDWTTYGFQCELDFPSTSATALAGTSVCAGNEQEITADRTCQ